MQRVFLGEKVRQRREALDKSREWLALKSGRSHSAIVGYELGTRTPSLAAVTRLADALGVEPGYFFGTPGRAA